MDTQSFCPYEKCNLCAHRCNVDRAHGQLGRCGAGDKLIIARAALHKWEEPIISGNRGSGAIFFSGCSLGCLYCQNREISRLQIKKEISVERLSEIMLELSALGAHNINLVTPTHFAPSVISATEKARCGGLDIPIVYNTSSFDSPETVRALDSTVNVYLADMKYYTQRLAEKYSCAKEYPNAAKAAIDEMVKQKGRAVIENSLIKSGVVIRILLLPGNVADAKLSCSYILDRYGDDVYVSRMSQYTPPPNMPAPLDRKVLHSEYEELCDFAIKKGLKNGFFQDVGSASEDFIPEFDLTGV